MEVSMDFVKPYYDDNDVEAVYKTLQPREVIVDLPPEVSEVVKQWAIVDAVTMLEPWLDKLNAVGSPDSLSLYRDIEEMMFEEPDKAYHGVCAARRWLDDYERERNAFIKEATEKYAEIMEHPLAKRLVNRWSVEEFVDFCSTATLTGISLHIGDTSDCFRDVLIDEVQKMDLILCGGVHISYNQFFDLDEMLETYDKRKDELRIAEECRNDEYRRTIDSYKEIAEHEVVKARGSGFITMEGLQGYAKASGLSGAAEYVERAKERFKDRLILELAKLHDKAEGRSWRKKPPMLLHGVRRKSYMELLDGEDLYDLMKCYEVDKDNYDKDERRQRSLDDKRRQQEVKDKQLRDLRASVVELALKVDPCLLRPTVVDAFDKITDESVLQSDIERYTQELERREVPMNGS